MRWILSRSMTSFAPFIYSKYPARSGYYGGWAWISKPCVDRGRRMGIRIPTEGATSEEKSFREIKLVPPRMFWPLCCRNKHLSETSTRRPGDVRPAGWQCYVGSSGTHNPPTVLELWKLQFVGAMEGQFARSIDVFRHEERPGYAT